MMHVLVVDEPSQDDSGVYECVRVRRSDGMAVEGRQRNITISKTRGQMRVLNISKSLVEITEGESIEIFVEIDIYPASEYKHRWYKTYNMWGESVRREEVNEVFTSTARREKSDSWRSERLHIANAETDDAGIYQLEVRIGEDFGTTLNWTVVVHPLKREVDISMVSHNNLGNDVVLVGSTVVVSCKINDENVEGIKLQVYNVSEKRWIDASSAQLEIQKYTYDSFLRWNVTLLNDTTFRCIDERNAEEQKLLIRLSAITEMDIIRVERDGHIFLICRLPIGEEGEVYWFKDDEGIGPINATVENFVQNFPVDTSIFSSPTGKFECMADTDSDRVSQFYEV
uniref:Protein kinase domain-containing protein n=1 Tax=Parascaris univalens TaxID=6257 RepID=A0A915CEX9_PARUN